MGSGDVINVPSFIKIDSGIQNTHTHTGSNTILKFYFIFLNKEIRLKNNKTRV
jgi:hypothetical protein